jgi:hypothetical protein
LAILGGNEKLVEWLASDRFTPLRCTPRKGRKKSDGPILTSKGRSPLAIAMLHQRLDIIRFLVAEKGMSLFEEKEIGNNLALANFTSLLKMLPDNFFDGKKMESTSVPNYAASLSNSFSMSSNDSSPRHARRPSM